MKMRTLVGAGAIVGLVSLAACAPPHASSVKLCRNGGAAPVYVTPATACPARGWYVLDPAKGGRTQQSFPYGPSLTTSTGAPRLDADAQGVEFIARFYQRNPNGSVSLRTWVWVVGPRFMVPDVAVETVDGYMLATNVAPLP